MSTTAQTTDEIQAAARELYRQSVAAEMPLSGKQLGAQFGKGDRWGRLRIGEVKAETGSGTTQPEAERHDDAGRHGGTETGPERNSAAEQAEQEPKTGPEPPVGETGQDEDLSDPQPEAEPPTAGGGAVPEPGSAVPDVGTGGGNHAAAGGGPTPETLPPVPRSAPVVPDTAPRHSAVPPAEPVSVPEGSAVPRAGLRLAWAAFLVGTAASIAANVAHAVPQVGARLAGGFVPLALILAVELMCRPLWRRKGWQWQLARYGGTGLVALVTAVMSYSHMRGLLLKYGETDLNATIGPLAVDGLMIVAGFALLAVNDRSEK